MKEGINMKLKKAVKIWLIIGLVMLFFQIFIGGVTRLTGSGLSITKWEIITGTIPPLNAYEWEEAFSLYKNTPQYKKINKGMSMSDFKFIYFWEYLHRLWARSMGFVFLIPFLFFLYKGWLERRLIRKLLILVGLTAVVATFGWIMVASGLNDRPWVSAYKLTWHLSLALIVFYYMAWIVFDHVMDISRLKTKWKTPFIFLFILVAIQIMIGGIMSGSKAGLFFPTWPDMNGELLPSILLNPENWIWTNFILYDENVFFPALVQFCHRLMGYVVFCFGLVYGLKYIRNTFDQSGKIGIAMIGLLCLQVVLGILTVLYCRGSIPLFLGITHQAVAIFLELSILWLIYKNTDR